MSVTITDIEAAQSRLAGHARVTPLLSSPFLDEIAGRRVFVKAEALQKTGSFKYRGAYSAISALDPDTRKHGVLAFSSGNHAQGVAMVAQEFDIPAAIVMPSDAPEIKIANTRALGAEVIPYDRAREDRDEIGARLAKERGLTLIKPFDNPMVIAGQGTSGLEIAAQAEAEGIEKAEVLVCCGGGGLTAGISLALAEKAPQMRVRPVEPEGFDDVARSLREGTRQFNDSQSGSLCDAIMTPAPGELTFPIIKEHCGTGIVVSDEDALRAMAAAFARLRIVLEPGGAVALAAALYHPDTVTGDTVIAMASGGNVDPEIFTRAIKTYGDGS